MCPKDAGGMANSVDLDQTAMSNLIRVYTVCPDLSVRKLRIITVRLKPALAPALAFNGNNIKSYTNMEETRPRKRNLCVSVPPQTLLPINFYKDSDQSYSVIHLIVIYSPFSPCNLCHKVSL